MFSCFLRIEKGMGSLLSLYFLHPITPRLSNKTQRIYSRYELTNPTKTPPPPFVFSLLSVILLHLYYTLHPLSTLFIIPFSLCYYPLFSCYPVSSSPVTIPCSFVTLSPHPLLLSPVPLLLCLLIPCLSSPHPLLLPPVPLLLCLLLPCLSSPHPLLLSLVPLLLCPPFTLSHPPCRVKNVYLSYPQGPLLCPRQGLSSMQNMPFLPLEDALLVP